MDDRTLTGTLAHNVHDPRLLDLYISANGLVNVAVRPSDGKKFTFDSEVLKALYSSLANLSASVALIFLKTPAAFRSVKYKMNGCELRLTCRLSWSFLIREGLTRAMFFAFSSRRSVARARLARRICSGVWLFSQASYIRSFSALLSKAMMLSS
jgi:hypothetical protein